MNNNHSCFSEIFNELYIHSSPDDSSSSSTPRSSVSSDSSFFKKPETLSDINIPKRVQRGISHSIDHGFFSDNSSTCTEGLGFESFDDVDDDLSIKNEILKNKGTQLRREAERKFRVSKNSKIVEHKWSRRSKAKSISEFPPPISCIGISGKPVVCFKTFRQSGRFILKEVRAQSDEYLHASRENGRLRMRLVHSDDEWFDEDDEELSSEKSCENIDKDIDGGDNKQSLS